MSEPLALQAIAALRSEDYVSARNLIADYAKRGPMELRHYLIRGLAELALKDWGAARRTFADAWLRYPDDAALPFNLGIAQENLGDFNGARISYERSLEIDSNLPDACGNLSNIYCRVGKFIEAETMARRALDLGAPRAQVLNSLGLALGRQYKFVEAAAMFDEALTLSPENPDTLANRANLAVDGLDFETACLLFARARAASKDSPLIRHHEGMARLLAGEYQNGWELCEARLEIEGSLRTKPKAARWNGENLTGKKLIVIAEQGLGDAIQFSRYGEILKQRGAELVWIIPESLKRLFAHNVGGEIVCFGDPSPRADYYVPMLSLPLALGMLRPEECPRAPYFTSLNEVELPHAEKDGRKKIGIVWSGSPTHARDFERSISLRTLAPLFANDQLRFYAPFTGIGPKQITGEPIIRLDHLIHDFADTAAYLMKLDALVTVDTAVAHLAGALGVKTYLMLPYCPDWRWGTRWEKTPWYPSITLARQPHPGDWASVVVNVSQYLRRLQ